MLCGTAEAMVFRDTATPRQAGVLYPSGFLAGDAMLLRVGTTESALLKVLKVVCAARVGVVRLVHSRISANAFKFWYDARLRHYSVAGIASFSQVYDYEGAGVGMAMYNTDEVGEAFSVRRWNLYIACLIPRLFWPASCIFCQVAIMTTPACSSTYFVVLAVGESIVLEHGRGEICRSSSNFRRCDRACSPGHTLVSWYLFTIRPSRRVDVFTFV